MLHFFGANLFDALFKGRLHSPRFDHFHSLQHLRDQIGAVVGFFQHLCLARPDPLGDRAVHGQYQQQATKPNQSSLPNSEDHEDDHHQHKPDRQPQVVQKHNGLGQHFRVRRDQVGPRTNACMLRGHVQAQCFFNQDGLDGGFDLNAETDQDVKFQIDGQCVANSTDQQEKGEQQRKVGMGEGRVVVGHVQCCPRDNLGLKDGADAPTDVAAASREPPFPESVDEDGSEARPERSRLLGRGVEGRRVPELLKVLGETVALGVVRDGPDVFELERVVGCAVLVIVVEKIGEPAPKEERAAGGVVEGRGCEGGGRHC